MITDDNTRIKYAYSGTGGIPDCDVPQGYVTCTETVTPLKMREFTAPSDVTPTSPIVHVYNPHVKPAPEMPMIEETEFLIDRNPLDNEVLLQLKEIMWKDQEPTIKMFEFTSIYEVAIYNAFPTWLAKVALNWVHWSNEPMHRQLRFYDDHFDAYQASGALIAQCPYDTQIRLKGDDEYVIEVEWNDNVRA